MVQIGVATNLLIAKNPLDRTTAVPMPTMTVVPEIGQIAAPPPSSVAPPLPGSLMAPAPTMAPPPVSSAPPPIGSFQQPGSRAPATPMAPPSMPVQPVPMPRTSVPAPTPAAPPSAFTNPAPGAFLKPQPAKTDAATELLRDVNYVVTTAKEIRGVGDMNGALEMLRRADELTPDHPAIIAETAQTYELMGVATKATDNWRRIQLLGETKAGSYFELASRRLGAGPAAAAPAIASIEGDKTLRLGACQVARDLTVSSGERYAVRVPIVRTGSQPIDGKAVNLEVFFFDRVNGMKVAQTIAPEPLETWHSAPVDWGSSTGEETLDVVYHLPALSAAEVQQHGRRAYYGYMLRLYYNNKLQDVAAEPRDLLEFGSAPGAASAGANPLLPPVGR
jgi:hypothetical protein